MTDDNLIGTPIEKAVLDLRATVRQQVEQEMQQTLADIRASHQLVYDELRTQRDGALDTRDNAQGLIARVRALHARVEAHRSTIPFCNECGSDWPCATASTIGEVGDRA